MAELKPCPFCGEEAKICSCDGSGGIYSNLGTDVLRGRKLDHLLIMCPRCGVKTKAYLTDRGVFKAWNRRTPAPKTPMPHGRLIDAAAYRRKLNKLYESSNSEQQKGILQAIEMLEEMQSIGDAEQERETDG